MKTAKDYRTAIVSVEGYIEYTGGSLEEVASKFERRYGVEPTLVEDEQILVIPATPEIEQDFCYALEQMCETCETMGLRPDDICF